MRTSATFVAVAAVATLLVGCTANQSDESPDANDGPSASPETPAPTPTPTPTVLSDDEAGERYLDIVCATNASGGEFNEAYLVAEEVYQTGVEPDLSDVKEIAATRMEQIRMTAELLDDELVVWPDSVAALIPHVRDGLFAELSTLNGWANADSFEATFSLYFPERTDEQQSAGQEIRYALDLSPDTTASCEGHVDNLQSLHDAMAAREGD